MKVSDLSGVSTGLATPRVQGDAAAAVTALNDPAAKPEAQLDAYQALAGRWRVAPQGEKAALAQVLNDSPFGQKVHAALNAFTRAAWPGKDAAPPAPQAQALKAFEALPDGDRQIVARMQTDASTGAAYASAGDYHARLKSDLETAQVLAAARRPDTVTLSSEAQARLAGEDAPKPAQAAAPASPQVATALAAYSRLNG